jgi:glycosyltransferase involved in cell wall biosynthesis
VVWAIHGDDSSHEIAARFHRESGVPWVADFKDAWNVFHSRSMWPLQWLVTRNRLRTATMMTETSDAQARLDGHLGCPWHVVWSGYDDGVMAKVPPVRVSERFTLGYFGNVAAQHDVPRLARALAAGADVPFELHVFGGHDPARWRSALGDIGLVPRLHLHAMIAQDDAFARMKGVDLLLLLPAANFGRSRFAIGVKELEYFASGTPVLSIGRLLPELRGLVGPNRQLAEAETEADAARFLREEFAAHASGSSSVRRASVNAPAVARHSWTGQARLLAEILETAARGTLHRELAC